MWAIYMNGSQSSYLTQFFTSKEVTSQETTDASVTSTAITVARVVDLEFLRFELGDEFTVILGYENAFLMTVTFEI